jgi:hypothetical protein
MIIVNYVSKDVHKTYKFKGPLTYSQIMKKLKCKTGAPIKDIVLYNDNIKLVRYDSIEPSKFIDTKKSYDDIKLFMKFRPVYGDHIHTLYLVCAHVDGSYKFLSPLADVEPIEKFNGENAGDPPYYMAKGIMSSVHVHGDGKIHIHPSTSAPYNRSDSEGLNCTLKLFYPMAGCKYQTINNLPSLEFQKNINLMNLDQVTSKTNYTYVGNTLGRSLRLDPSNTHQWCMYAWDSFEEFKKRYNPVVYHRDLENIWLHNDNNVYVFAYVPIEDFGYSIPQGIKAKLYETIDGHIDMLEKMHSRP